MKNSFYYYRARFYDPNTGRFLQKDPEPGKIEAPITVINNYAYCGNNPANFTDPTGRIFGIDDLLFLGLAALAGGLINSATNGGITFQNFFSGFFSGLEIGGAMLGIAALTNGILGYFGTDITLTGIPGVGSATLPLKGAAGAGWGFLSTSGVGSIVASVLAVPAVLGRFNPNAPEWMRTYANFFSGIGNSFNVIHNLVWATDYFGLAQAGPWTVTLGARDITLGPLPLYLSNAMPWWRAGALSLPALVPIF